MGYGQEGSALGYGKKLKVPLGTCKLVVRPERCVVPSPPPKSPLQAHIPSIEQGNTIYSDVFDDRLWPRPRILPQSIAHLGD